MAGLQPDTSIITNYFNRQTERLDRDAERRRSRNALRALQSGNEAAALRTAPELVQPFQARQTQIEANRRRIEDAERARALEVVKGAYNAYSGLLALKPEQRPAAYAIQRLRFGRIYGPETIAELPPTYPGEEVIRERMTMLAPLVGAERGDPRKNYINVPNVGLVDVSGETPSTVVEAPPSASGGTAEMKNYAFATKVLNMSPTEAASWVRTLKDKSPMAVKADLYARALTASMGDAATAQRAAEEGMKYLYPELYPDEQPDTTGGKPAAAATGGTEPTGYPAIDRIYNRIFGGGASEETQDQSAVIEQAKAAIAQGADPAAVKERLRQMGIDPGELDR